jgi:hypothetical protein
MDWEPKKRRFWGNTRTIYVARHGRRECVVMHMQHGWEYAIVPPRKGEEEKLPRKEYRVGAWPAKESAMRACEERLEKMP